MDDTIKWLATIAAAITIVNVIIVIFWLRFVYHVRMKQFDRRISTLETWKDVDDTYG